MAFTPTADILKRVEAALEFDLLGQTSRSFNTNDPNDGLQPLHSDAVVNYVMRYLLDPEMQAYSYVSARQFGLTVGYSWNSQQPEGPRGATGQSRTHTIPLEVTFFGIVRSAEEINDEQRGFQFDDLTDDLMRIFQGGRRQAPQFGGPDIRQVTLEGVQKLPGDPQQPFVGRTHRIDIRRDLSDLQ